MFSHPFLLHEMVGQMLQQTHKQARTAMFEVMQEARQQIGRQTHSRLLHSLDLHAHMVGGVRKIEDPQRIRTMEIKKPCN
jgi:hypothetical protein